MDQIKVATKVAVWVAIGIMAEVQVDLDLLQAVHLTTVKQKKTKTTTLAFNF